MDFLNKELLGVLSIVSGVIGLAVYMNSIRSGETKPHCFSWFIWAILMIIGFMAQRSVDAGPGAWVTGLSGIACLFIAAYAYHKGEKDITRSDRIAFTAAICAIPVWYFTKDPLSAVIIISVIDATAFYPTFRKSWHKPYEESLLTYSINCVTFCLSIAALSDATWTTVLYPATLVVTNFIFIAVALARRGLVAQNG